MPGFIQVTGSANSSATVTVNNQPTYRNGNYFQKELVINNTSGPVYQQVKVVGVKNNAGPNGEDAVTQETGNRYLQQANEVFVYDLDGNLLSDGLWTYTWDAENRLVSMQSISTVANEGKRRLEFSYDYMSRRIQKKGVPSGKRFDVMVSNSFGSVA